MSRARPTPGRIAAAARWLVDQHLPQRLPFDGFPAGVAPRDAGEAYAVQDAFVARKSRGCGAPVGWKIALANPAMQRFVGLDEPIAARLLARQVVAAPAFVRAADYGRLIVEFEIAVELGRDIGPADRGDGFSRDALAPAVAAVGPALEIADDRGADYASLAAHGLQLIADNAWNEGAVLGTRRTDWASLDLAAIRGTALIDGKPAGEGRGRELMGHPLDALAWLADRVTRRGLTMRAGEIAILGTLVTSKFPHAGQRVAFELEGFESTILDVG